MQTLETTERWQTLFENWPDSIQRRGIIISTTGEAVPFINFMVSDGLLLVERDGPDASGTRRVILSYDAISIVKLVGGGELSQFHAMGFQASL